MAAERLWTVVRFPNGSWSYGGKPDSPDYEQCEVWQIPADSAQKAVRKAQARRSHANRKTASAASAPSQGGELSGLPQELDQK